MKVCLDASFVIKILIPEPLSDLAESMWRRWAEEDVRCIAPSFMPVEVISALRRRGKLNLDPSLERRVVRFFVNELLLFIDIYEPSPRILKRAWSIAHDLNFTHIYDAVYIALAEVEGCPFWTADQKLFRAVKDKFNFVSLLGADG